MFSVSAKRCAAALPVDEKHSTHQDAAAAQVSLLYGTLYLIFMWAVWLPVEDYWVRWW
jgi:hypothetical protein